MSRSIRFAFLFLFSQNAVYSQTSISGKIVDTTQSPVPFAIVALLNTSDSAIVKGIISDEKGIYVFNQIHPGNYFLKITASGYDEKNSPELKFDSLHSYVVPDISLHHSRVLDAVTVTAIKSTIEFKGGNIIVNVEDSPLSKGNSVYD
ncbi:MAG TPA: carboxypeptidase-like regulatory domain-containing protein, partial [Bacteroidia bacterium]|nr:carboxypeptidase-like regulatory domain-containing protein [Bacteroidia bacterium]